VTDREFNLSDLFPSGFHVFCWNHIERDLFFLKKQKGCSVEEVNYYSNSFRNLMMNHTETEFDLEWDEARSNNNFKKNQQVLNYFEIKLLPCFKTHPSIWALKIAGIPILKEV
jgi:hypothetical protein